MLKGDKIILQPFSSKFISKEYLFWINDKDIAKFIDKAKDTTTIQELNSFAISMINSNYDYFFAIIYKKNLKHIGNVRLGPINFDFKVSNFGILIGDKNFHSSGIATEVLKLIKHFGFNYLKLNKISFPVIEAHTAAMKLYAKANFSCLGVMSKTFNKNGKSWKLVEWSMTNEDYKKTN